MENKKKSVTDTAAGRKKLIRSVISKLPRDKRARLHALINENRRHRMERDNIYRKRWKEIFRKIMSTGPEENNAKDAA